MAESPKTFRDGLNKLIENISILSLSDLSMDCSVTDVEYIDAAALNAVRDQGKVNPDIMLTDRNRFNHDADIEAKKIKANPKFIEAALQEFIKLQKAIPNYEPKGDGISIDEYATKGLTALKEAFSNDMKGVNVNLNADGIDPNAVQKLEGLYHGH